MEGGWEDNVADRGSYLFSCHTANLNKSGQGGNVDMNQFVITFFFRMGQMGQNISTFYQEKSNYRYQNVE